MKDFDKYTDREWEELAARFSGENTSPVKEADELLSSDELSTESRWNEIGKSSVISDVNVDRGWEKLHGRLKENGLLTRTARLPRRNMLLRIAAAIALVAGLGTAALYLSKTGIFSGKTTIVADNATGNKEVLLPDGSKVWLNRNSELVYGKDFGKKSRNVKLLGEAYFDVAHDESRQFTIDAGKATVKDLGTSFNVITSNSNREVEVFVSSGKVLLSDISGSSRVELEPGYIGTIGSNGAKKSVNENQNYLSWRTRLLVYTGERLSTVFADLKRVHNIDVIADDPDILNETISTTFDKLPQDTVISIICTTFNFRFNKEGQTYHLSRK